MRYFWCLTSNSLVMWYRSHEILLYFVTERKLNNLIYRGWKESLSVCRSSLSWPRPLLHFYHDHRPSDCKVNSLDGQRSEGRVQTASNSNPNKVQGCNNEGGKVTLGGHQVAERRLGHTRVCKSPHGRSNM